MPDDGGGVGEKLVKMIQKQDNDQVVKLLGVLGTRRAMVYTTQEGLPLLHVAILHHNHHVARLLLDRGADPSFKDAGGRTALHAAAEADNVWVVVDLLKRCSVNLQDENGDTALHIAVQKCSVEMVKWLIFAGADPFITNKKKIACRMLATKNYVCQLLRDFTRCRPPLTFAQLVPSKSYYLESLHLTLRLSEGGGTACVATDFLYYAKSPRDLSSVQLGNIQEEEEVWGSVVDYRLTQPLDVTLTFDLLDLVDSFRELVLRLMSTDSDSARCRDVLLDIQEIEPPTIAAIASKTVTTTKSTAAVTSDPSAGVTSDSDVTYLAHAQGRARLDTAGLLLLLCRPVQQDVCLGAGIKKITARLDPRVEVSVPEDFQNKIQGQLQLEPSCPVNEPAALAKAPPVPACEFESQSNYVKLRTTETEDVVTADLTMNLPIPEGFSGGLLHLVVRTSTLNSIDSRYLPLADRRDSTTSASDSEVEDEKEAQRWTRTSTFSIPRDSHIMTVPMPVNKTLTVVETKKSTSEEKMRKRVAKQYRKRKHKLAVFFVAARPWIGWRVCRDVLVVVTSPSKLSRELGRHLVDGYCLIHVTGEFRVAPLTDFRLSVIGDQYVEHGDREAIITLRHVVHLEQSGHLCNFILRKKREEVTHGRLLVEQKRKKKTKEGPSTWKLKGELHFDMSSISEVIRVPSEVEQELTSHFSDTLLVDLVEKLPLPQCPALGQRLGLSAAEMDKVLNNPSLISPRFKCFELLRRCRDKSPNTVQYGRCLFTALTDLNCTEQCQWLTRRLAHWPQLKEVQH